MHQFVWAALDAKAGIQLGDAEVQSVTKSGAPLVVEGSPHHGVYARGQTEANALFGELAQLIGELDSARLP